jgi:hypothetical protein
MKTALIGLLLFNVLAAAFTIVNSPTVVPSPEQQFALAQTGLSKLSTSDLDREDIGSVLEVNAQVGLAKHRTNFVYTAYRRIQVPMIATSALNVIALFILAVKVRNREKSNKSVENFAP